MKRRPWIVKLVALSLFVVPVTAMVLVYTSSARVGLQTKSTVILDLWVLAIASCVAAMGIWRVRPWGFFAFFGFILGILAGDIHHIIKDPTTLNHWDIIDGVVAAAGIILILQRHVTAPYFNPRIRWWETATRHRADFEGKLTFGDKTISTKILDVSETGCFVDWDEKSGPKENELTRGQVFSIGMKFEHYFFESPVRVVRTSAQPRGVGLAFQDTTKDNEREIKRLLKSLARRDTPLRGAA